ncbi:MAG: polyprenol monophosphomannose synthase [Williamsia herbipolensis]|uniref:Dolichol-phosphate mannosyltransferase n=1 Tax=Williamsia serinedens TaxID=391736 RepID=A0ABT1GWI7_9NOCA|nr:polyprenol monophosphomannose synthase [Williamsia serinedens]MBE7160812.1 polyprenol monophosphomannose synthase [Williamsia herbipolensis]MCP2159326.1 dolichol-phosphate mannosyltransferase [Williamsia serinedens]
MTPRTPDASESADPTASAGAPATVGPDGSGALVIIPTYNERENLPLIVERLHGALAGAHVLVVDDGSPDGTGDLADSLASRDADGRPATRIHVLHRAEKSGLGGAYIAGFGWGLERDYTVLVEMDADGSHAPEQLHRLLEKVNAGNDLVIGSRYVPGGALVNWPRRRKWLSQGANTYSRLALGVQVRDITAGYRAYRREVLQKIDLDSVDSHGYCFQIDLAWRAIQAGFRVAEVPITFTERQIGESKMSGDVIGEAFMKVLEWGMAHRVEKFRRRSR